jgi:hypothetical protein
MPIVDKTPITADEAYQRGLCPECGVALAGRDLKAHVQDHWPHGVPADPRFAEAARRVRMILDHAQPAIDAAKEEA